MKNKLHYVFIMAVAMSAMINWAQAATIVNVDFGTSSSNVQAGFTAQTTGAATTYATDAGDITIASTGSFFNRSASQSYNEAALMGDFTFNNGGALTFTIEGVGIAANTGYDIQFWSYDSQHGSTGGTVTFTGVSGTSGSTSIAYSNANLDPNTNNSTTNWISNSSGQIIIDVTGTNEGPRVNGLEITVVPEPSSFALLAGCFGLTWVMLRRRS